MIQIILFPNLANFAEKPSFRLPIKNSPIHLFAENNLCTFTEASKRDKGDA